MACLGSDRRLMYATIFCVLSAGAFLAGSINHASAQAYWDGAGADNGTIDGGSGTWNNDPGNLNWTSDDGSTNSAWVNDNLAIFQAAPGTVTVAGTVNVSALTFNVSGYTVTGGQLAVANGGGFVTDAFSSATVNSQVIGNIDLSYFGNGSITVGGNNTYAGTTIVDSGTVIVANVNALGANTNTLQVADGTLNLNGTSVTQDVVILNDGLGSITNGTINATTGLIQNGGTFSAIVNTGVYQHDGGTMSGTANATAYLQSAGTLSNIANVSTYSMTGGTMSGTVTATTTFDLQAGTVSGTLAGAGGLVKAGAGVVTLSGANSYGGGTTIEEGTLQISGAGTLGSTSATTTVNGGTLNLGTTTQTQATVILDGGTISNGTLNATTGFLHNSGTFSGTTTTPVYAQAGGFMSGTVNGDVYALSGGTLSGVANVSSYSMSGGTMSGTVTASTSFDLQAGTVSGVLAGAGTLVKSDTGVVTLSGVNTYAGGTLVEDGTLLLSGVGTLGGVAATTQVTGGLLDLGTTIQTQANVILDGGTIGNGTLNATTGFLHNAGTFSGTTTTPIYFQGGGLMSGTVTGDIYAQADGTLSGTANVDIYGMSGGIMSGTVTAATGFDMQAGTVSGVLAGAGTLVKSDTGVVTLSGANTYTGGTLVQDGTLLLSGGGTLGSVAATTVVSGGLLDLGTTTQIQDTVVLEGGTIGNGTLNATTVFVHNDGTFSGTTTTPIYAQTGGVMSGTVSAEVFGMTGGLVAASGLITATDGFDMQGGIVEGVLAGEGALVKSTDGLVVLTGTNTYTGPTSVLEGTLLIGGGSAIIDTGIVGVDTAGTLELVSDEVIGALVGTGTVNVNENFLTVGLAGDAAFGGLVDGTGGLIKVGDSAFTLVNASVSNLAIVEGSVNLFSGFVGGLSVLDGTVLNVRDVPIVGTLLTTGIVDYRDGATDDTLGVGTYFGGGAMAVDLDIGKFDATAQLSDQLIVTTDASGLTIVVFNVISNDSVVLADEIVVVDGAGDAEFLGIINDNSLLIDYNFVRNAAGQWVVRSDLNSDQAGASFGIVPSVLTTIQTALTPTNNAALHPGAGAEDGRAMGMWMRTNVGTLSQSINGAAINPGGGGSFVFSGDTTYTLMHGGADFALNNGGENGTAYFGIAGGLLKGSLVSDQVAGAQVSFTAPFAGGYLAFEKGPLDLEAGVRVTDYNFEVSDPFQGSANLGGMGVTVYGNASYEMSLAGLSIVPTGGLAWTRSDVDALVTPGTGTLVFADHEALVGHVGVGVSGTIETSAQAITISPFATALLWHDFSGAFDSNFVQAGGGNLPITLDAIGTYGQVSLGISGTDTDTKVTGFVKGDVLFAKDTIGFSGSVGLSKAF